MQWVKDTLYYYVRTQTCIIISHFVIPFAHAPASSGQRSKEVKLPCFAFVLEIVARIHKARFELKPPFVSPNLLLFFSNLLLFLFKPG